MQGSCGDALRRLWFGLVCVKPVVLRKSSEQQLFESRAESPPPESVPGRSPVFLTSYSNVHISNDMRQLFLGKVFALADVMLGANHLNEGGLQTFSHDFYLHLFVCCRQEETD